MNGTDTDMKKAIQIILIISLVLIVVTVGAAAYRAWDASDLLAIRLNGEQKFYVEYQQAYTEPGATAILHAADGAVELPVSVEGTVDSNKLGKYRIKYTIQADDNICTEYRYVYVVDTQAPVITLKENPDIFTFINEPYAEEGFTAADNYDGDLTDRVIRWEENGVVTYTVSDSFGNTSTVKRTIRYMDPGLPNLQLEGGQMSFITAGENYVEPGYTAIDTNDGDISSDVVVTGVVDNLNAGVYTLHYTVTNSLGTTANKDRTVYVIPRQDGESDTEPDNPGETDTDNPIDIPTGGTTIVPNGKTIYLTFDDGPSKNTERLLDILAKYKVKATFFVMNTSNIPTIARTANEGHTVAIHTYTHRYSQIYANDQAFLDDMKAMQDVIFQHTGIVSMLTRFPGGSSNSVSSAYNKGIMTRLTQHLEAEGYQYFDWNVDSNDAGGAKTADEVFNNVIKGVSSRTNSVVLQHDTQDFSVDAVERIIAWGLCNGYTFKALDKDSPTCHHGVNN